MYMNISYSFFKVKLLRGVQMAIFFRVKEQFSQQEIYKYVLKIHHCEKKS
jgi:hypothetical protein